MPRLRGPILITLALLALVLLAWLPFLQQDLPRSNDGRLHLYRIIALDDAWTRDGRLYPRYASNLVYGYGASLFNYFPPIAYVPGALLHHAGLSYTQAFQATIIGALFIAAAGMYALASSTWPGDARYRSYAGLGAAAFYIYSPYLLFDAVGRGTLTEVVSLAVLPWVLWAMMRVARIIDKEGSAAQENGGRVMTRPYIIALKKLLRIDIRSLWPLGIFIGLLALFIPLHNVVTLHGGLLLIFVGIALLWQSPRRGRLFIAFIGAGLMAGLMSVFFLAPALLEGNDVKIRAVTEALSFIDVTRTLRPLTDLFALYYTSDPTNLQPNTPIVYSWIALAFSLCALWRLRRVKSVRALVISLIAIFALTLLLMWETPIGVWLWRAIPLLDYTQFAWRVLGIGSLALAWLGGWGAAALIQRIEMMQYENKARLAPTVAAWIVPLLAVLLYGLPWTIARHEPIPANSIVDAQTHERASGELALSSYSEYLPTWVETPPDPERLQNAFASGQPVPRLQQTEGVIVKEARWGGTEGLIAFETAQPTTLVFDWLYMPGWTARFTNESVQSLPLTVKPLAPHGLVSVEVPAGSYSLEIWWQETSLQRTSSLISLVGWGLWLVGIVFVGARQLRARCALPLQPDDRGGEDATHSLLLYRQPFITAMLVGIGIAALKIVIIDHQTDQMWRAERYANDTRPPIATFADQIIAREVILGQRAIRAGEMLPITIYWQVGQTPLRDESTLIELRDANGQVVAVSGSFQPGGLAMTHWQPGTYVMESALLNAPADAPPGNYTVTLGLYDPVSKEPRSVLNEAGNPQDVKTVIGSIGISRPETPAAPVESIPLTDTIAFAGIKTPLPAEASPGQEFVFDPAWQMLAPWNENLYAELRWQPATAEDISGIVSPPMFLVPIYDLDQWQVGDVWRGAQTLFVPGDLETGDYVLWLGLVDTEGESIGEAHQIATIQITAPERTFVLPQGLNEKKILWRGGLSLQGYTGRIDDFTLYWQTEQSIQANLRLSVQMIDAEGQIIAQEDSVPVNWTRPVAGWAVGEVIATPYTFDLPEGEYQARVVWYDAVTGERVLLDDGSDAAVIDMK